MHCVKRQSCVKLHAWPQVQFVIDVLGRLFRSRRGINKSFSEQLHMGFFHLFSCSLSHPLCLFYGPRPAKTIWILLQESTVLIWQHWSRSAVLEIFKLIQVATAASVSWSCITIKFILRLQSFVIWSKMSVWTVYQRSTVSVCLSFHSSF